MSRIRIALALVVVLLGGVIVAPSASAAVAGQVAVDGFESDPPALTTSVGSATAAVSTDRVEGGAAVAVSYDVSAGMAELSWAEGAAVPTPATGLTVSLRGDGTYNTVYLRLRDSTGETFVYRVDAMRSTVYQTLPIDLTAAPVTRDGGDADGVLDAPLAMAGVLVVRNGAQPATGTFLLDDLRATVSGWTLPVAAAPYLPAGDSAQLSFEAGAGGDWGLTLTDAQERTRTLTGTATGPGTVALTWDGTDDSGAPMTGGVGAVFRQDSTPGNAVAGGTTTGIPLLLTLATGDDPAVTDLVEGFDAGNDGWSVAVGSAVLGRGGVDRTQGTDALAVDYDLAGGMVGITRTAPLDVASAPVTGLKVDLLGDGSYNTVYVRIADATGEAFTYRLDAMRRSTWTTVPVDLTQDPVLVEGGNADSLLDMPLTLTGFFVVRNGEQPATGSLVLDNLRVVSSRWTMPVSDVAFLTPAENGPAQLSFTAATPGDWMIVLRDASGRQRNLTGTRTAPGEQQEQWDGRADDGSAMEGSISSIFLQDSTPDGAFAGSRTRSATPVLLTVAAAAPISSSVTEGFEGAASTWSVAVGSASISRVASPTTQGAFAQRIAYDLTPGLVETVQRSPATLLSAPATGLRIDLLGDGTYNTVYLRLRDSSNESFTYRLDAMRSTTWTTLDVDLTAPAALVEGGDGDRVLDMPVSLSGVVVVRNGAQPATGAVVLDNLRTLSSGWSLPVASAPFFTPSPGSTTTLTFTAGGPGDHRIELRDQQGRTRVLAGTASAAGTVSVPWDGTDDSGASMRGDVGAVFVQDSVADGSVAPNATRSGVPVLLTVADTDSGAALADSFDTAGETWIQAAGAASPSTTTTRTEGRGALRIAYDVSAADAEIETRTTPVALLTRPASALKVDMLGDGSYNTVFLKLQDATGEMFFHRVDAMGLTRWTTATIDLRTPAAVGHLGNGDGVLDYPVALVRVTIVRNGPSAPATGSVVLDALRVVDEDWTLPVSSASRFSRANAGSTALSFAAGPGGGDYELTVEDLSGRSRTFAGTAASAGVVTLAWDGTDAAGVGLSGSVSGRLRWDSTPNGTLDGSAWTAAQPYLTGVTARVTEASPTSISGINSFLTAQDDPAEADRQAALLEDASVRWAREEFEWKRVERREGYFEWAKFDQAVAVSRSRNVDMIGKLVYSAPWASSAPSGTPAEEAQYYPPADTADFTAYATAVVDRYKGSVDVWEVWNEPNTDYYWRGATTAQDRASQYGQLLKATYAAIKAADPTATVLVGGLDQFSDPFMQGVLGAGASFDGLAIHTYTLDGAPETSAIPTYLDAAQAFLARSAPGKSLWVTEVGWATCTSCAGATTEAAQADYLARSYLDAAARGVAAITWYNLVGGPNPQDPLDTFAVTERSGRLKPAYTALKDVGAVLAQGTAVGRAGATASAASVRADDLASTSGRLATTIGGGSAALTTTTDAHSGNGALRLAYSFPAGSQGAQIQSSTTLPGSPTAVSIWVNGDASGSPVYLKLRDATGESFQGLVGNAGRAGWTKMTLYSDGLNANYTHSGGDADGVWDYPVVLTDTFVYRSTSGVVSGAISLDDVTLDYGANVHGTVLQTPTGTVQALFATGTRAVSVQVSGPAASLLTAAGSTPLAVSSSHAAVTLGPRPVYVFSAPGVAPLTAPRGSTVSVDWMTGDSVTASAAVVSATGAVVRTLATAVRYSAGRQSLAWDGRLASGAVAPAGSYRVRISSVGPDGRVSVMTAPFTTT